MPGNSFVGTWSLISFEVRSSDGSITKPFGEDAQGTNMYDANGRFSVQVGRSDRAAFESADMRDGTVDEIRSAYLGYIAYLGTYDLNEAGGYVTHNVIQSLFPNWKGDAQRRYYEFEENRLTLSTPPMPFGGESMVAELLWERVS